MIKGNKLAGKAQEIMGSLLKPLPITPNEMTVASVLIAFAGLYFFMNIDYWMAYGLYALALLVDGLDGALARAKKLASPKGAFLDGVADRFVEFAMLIGFIGVGMPAVVLPAVYWIMGMLFFGTCMTSFIKAYADHRKALSHEEAVGMSGIFERAERVVLLLGVAIMIGLGSLQIASYMLAVGALLALSTVMQRVLWVAGRK
jgi:phosphatidylglycerophosphate synthase